MKKGKTIWIRISQEDYQEIEERRNKLGISLSGYVRMVIREFLDKKLDISVD